MCLIASDLNSLLSLLMTIQGSIELSYTSWDNTVSLLAELDLWPGKVEQADCSQRCLSICFNVYKSNCFSPRSSCSFASSEWQFGEV